MELKLKDFYRQEILKRRGLTKLKLFGRQKDCPMKVESRSSRKEEQNNQENPKAFGHAEKRAAG